MADQAIYKYGYPARHARQKARDAALKAATKTCEAAGFVVVGDPDISIIETDAHREAGEYLVRVELTREKAVT